MKIPIVNEQDEIIGYKDRWALDPRDLCRVTGLWVTDADGNILLAQRSFKKKHDPGIWGPAVSGTVEEGETYESNITKEAMEEIGLTGFNFALGPKIKRETVHRYFTQFFTVIVDHDYPFAKSEEEVEDIRWFTKDEILKLLNEKPEMFAKNPRQYMDLFLK